MKKIIKIHQFFIAVFISVTKSAATWLAKNKKMKTKIIQPITKSGQGAHFSKVGTLPTFEFMFGGVA